MADGHVEWWVWKDPRTIAFASMTWAAAEASAKTPQLNNPDLRKMQIGAWGRLGY
jgi:hypothetical protein